MTQDTNGIAVDVDSFVVIKASEAAVFAVITDHPGTPNWVKNVNKVTVLKDGSPHHGKGTIREVDFKPRFWTTVTEEVMTYQKDSHFEYRIVKGMPGLLAHLGRMELTDQGDGAVRLDWKVHFEFKKMHWFRLFLGSFQKQFKATQEAGLGLLKQQLES